MSILPTIMRRNNRKAFTLTELTIATGIFCVVFLSAWELYRISRVWWREMSPRIEAERRTRIALDAIVQGTVDATAGSDVISSQSYGKRNGLEEAVAEPEISADGRSIYFALEGDAANKRCFKLGDDEASGKKMLYYMSDRNNAATTAAIKPTLGITDLAFEFYQFTDGSVITLHNLIKVTVSSSEDISATRKEGVYSIDVSRGDIVCLRNMLYLD